MAVVGGDIPSARLRRRSALVTFVLQLLVLGYVAAVIGIAVAAGKADWRSDSFSAVEQTTTPVRPRPGVPPQPGATVVRTYEREPDGERFKSVFLASMGFVLLL